MLAHHWQLDTLADPQQPRAWTFLRLPEQQYGDLNIRCVQEQIDILFRWETLLPCAYTQYEHGNIYSV